MTDHWLAQTAWLGGSDLVPDVTIEIEGGLITAVTGGQVVGVPLPGVAMPGLVNAHSHAFHRLLRGRTHRQGGDFWVWRESMYDHAKRLTPESYEAIASAVYIEMALAGVTAVGEFHYVHHQERGTPYADPNEMAHALIRAARRAGIRIALLDVGYFRAGFGDSELNPVQERFRDPSVGAWLERAEALGATYRHDDDVTVGLAPHSVRAVSPAELEALADAKPNGVPLHIHVSEQPAENVECLEATGVTPTRLLDRTGVLGPDTTLIHATHLTDEDIAIVGRSGAGVCYCTTTERDLADGIGPAAKLRDAGVEICLGSDSHAIIDMFEEARGMEMHQRLTSGSRGVLDPADLARAATRNGAIALGLPATQLVAGAPADFVTVAAESPRLAGTTVDGPVDSVIFGAAASDIRDVFVAGDRIVSGGKHPGWDASLHALGPGP